MNFDWSELAFGSKKEIRALKATFIAAPREMSTRRFAQLAKEYLPKGNLVLGLAKEPHVLGFEDQPQFKMLQAADVQSVIDKVNKSGTKNKIYTLSYFQREQPFILEKISFERVLLVNGSWKHTFHTSPSYYMLTASKTLYQLISPFVDEQEARSYEELTDKKIIARLDATGAARKKGSVCNDEELMRIADLNATRSYDHSFQTGLALGERIVGKPKNYKFLFAAFNMVVPYQTYALHNGSIREKFFSPPNDLNYYDTVHAEVDFLTKYVKYLEDYTEAERMFKSLKNTVLFINLMPCPTCTRMLAQTEIEEFVYSIDHSDGYALQMLEAAGKKVRRVVV